LLQASLISAYEKLSNAETFAGITLRAARALGLYDRGQLAAGMKADFVTFPVTDFREILYQQGKLKPNRIWIGGKQVT
jgi:imidazolonepropionase